MKNTLLAIFMAAGIVIGTHAAVFADEIPTVDDANDPVVTSEEPTTEDLPFISPDDMAESYSSGSVGGGENIESYNGQEGNENQPDENTTDAPTTDESQDEQNDILENWPIIVSIAAIVIAMLMIVILNIRHRS